MAAARHALRAPGRRAHALVQLSEVHVVHFVPTENGDTEVRVVLRYDPPAGRAHLVERY